MTSEHTEAQGAWPEWTAENGRNLPPGSFCDEPGHEALAEGLLMFRQAYSRWGLHQRGFPSERVIAAAITLSHGLEIIEASWAALAEAAAADYEQEAREGGHALCRHRGGGAHPLAVCRTCRHPYRLHDQPGAAEGLSACGVFGLGADRRRCSCAGYWWEHDPEQRFSPLQRREQAQERRSAPFEAGQANPERN